MPSFITTRSDGRSNTQVVLDLVRDGEPGQVYDYVVLIDALNVGASRTFDVKGAQGAVRAALARMLREQQRTLHSVKLVGYRLARANEHTRLALSRKHRADTQMRHGMRLLRNVRWDEMSENERQAHTGMLLITEAIYANQVALERRQSAVEDALRGLKARVDDLGAGGT